MGITEAGCEGRKHTLAFQGLAYKKEAQGVFPELQTEQCRGDSLFPVQPAGS